MVAINGMSVCTSFMLVLVAWPVAFLCATLYIWISPFGKIYYLLKYSDWILYFDWYRRVHFKTSRAFFLRRTSEMLRFHTKLTFYYHVTQSNCNHNTY